MANIYIDEIYKKFLNGDPLTDEELKIGIAHFSKAAEMVSALGQRFDLAANELRRVAIGLEDFAAARRRR